MYDGSLHMLFNLDNAADIGEDDSTVVDVSSNGFSGTVSGAAYSDGKHGYAMQFDGINDYIEINSSAAILGTDPFAVGAWIKPVRNNVYQMIVNQRDLIEFDGEYLLFINDTGKIGWNIFGNSEDQFNFLSETTIPEGEWTHVLATRESDGSGRIFINGKLDATSAGTNRELVALSTYIGSDFRDDEDYFEGMIDSVTIWNRSLSAPEVYQHYISSLQKIDETQWYLYVNQSKNATEGLDAGDYAYLAIATDINGNPGTTGERIVSIQPGADLDEPQLDFRTPTPEDDATQSEDTVGINVSIAEGFLQNLTFSWNRTNYSAYDDSLVLMMNFNNISSENNTHFKDWSSTMNNGTAYGFEGDEIAGGRYGKGVRFDGTDDYIIIPDHPGLDFGAGEFAIAIWFNASDVSDIGSYQLLSKRVPGSNYEIQIDSDGVISVYLEGAGGVTLHLESQSLVSDHLDEWVYLALVRRGGTAYLYFNGEEEDSGASPHNVNTNNNLQVGRDYDGTGDGSEFFQGSIDELRIWNRGLSTEEIYQQYVSNLEKVDPEHWSFYVNQGKSISEGLEDGTYTYQMFASDESDNLGSTGERTITIESVPPVVLPLSSDSGASEWRMRGRYNNHTAWDGIAFQVIPGLNFKYYTTGASITHSSPVIADGYVYFGSSDSYVYQLNATDVTHLIAQFKTGTGISAPPAVAGGYVYISSNDKKVYQLNATDISHKIAQFTTGNAVIASPSVADGYVYVGSFDKKVYQLNATDISQKIAEFSTGNYVQSSVAVAGGYVYVGSNDYKVYQLNATDISQKIAEYRTGSGITSSPAVADGFVYVTSHDWRFYQLDASDISQLIAMYRSNIMLQNSPAVANGYAYVGISNKLHQFNASDISRTTNIDITPPNVLIASPGNNTYSNGNATISVSASDLSGISSVTFRIKNSTESYSTLCVDTTAPYACLWDTAEYDDSDGYVINVTAKDTKNNQASVAVHLMIDRNIPSSKDLILAYPSGQSSVRSGQVVTASIAALDEDAGIGIVMVDTTYAGSETNATMEHVSGSNASGQWGSWSTNITVTQSETGNYQLPVYITDRATPSNNTRDSDRLYIIVDNDAPGYSEQQHYGPVYSEEEIYFRIKVSDNLASYNFTESYIFSTNMSGSWVNDTRQVITDITEPIIVAKNGVTGNWSYRFYLFDDAGNVNETDVDDFEVYGDRPEFTIKLYSPENSNQTFSTDINFTYIYYNGTAPNCSLYIDSVLNQTVDSPEEGIVLSFEQTLSSGSYEWSVECYDNVSNETKQSSSKFFEIMADSDNDVLPDNTDRLWFDEDDVPAPGVSDLAIGVGEGNASGIYYSGEYEIRLYDSSDLMLNFSHDFTDDVLDLSRIKVIKGENSMIVNLSGQLQAGKKKTIYISDNGFIGLCVKDSEIASINQMSDGCDGASETDMTSCLGGSLTSNGIVCVDEGATIRIENLTHSAVRGTIPETISSSSGRSWDLRRDNCYSNWTCTEWSSCVGGSQTRSCTDVNCGSTYGRPAEIQNCSCVEEWNCGQWSGCSDGMQTRDCTDSNACGTTSSRPNQEQPCQAEISEAVTGNAALQPEDQIETEAQDENSNVWMAIVAILVLGGLIFLFYRRRRRKD